jgi:hypothetical protein
MAFYRRPSLSWRDDLAGDALFDVVVAVSGPQGDANKFEGNTEDTSRDPRSLDSDIPPSRSIFGGGSPSYRASILERARS